MSQPAVKKNDVLTFMQVVAAFSVIVLHTNGAFWDFSAGKGYWASANVIECLFYFPVPLFFMISGITLIDYQDRYSTVEFFPYAAWTVIAAFYQLMRGNRSTVTLKGIVRGLLDGESVLSIYWFFPALFCIYLSLPLFAAVDKAKRQSCFRYLFFIGLAFNIAIPFVFKVLGYSSIWSFNARVVSSYLIWIVAGVLLYNYPVPKKVKYLILLLGAAGLFAHILGTYYLSTEAGRIVSTYKGYNNLPSFLYVCAVFVSLEKLGQVIMKNKFMNRVISFLGEYPFALYLMHWFVLDSLRIWLNVDTTSLLWRLGAPLPIGLIVVGLTFLIRRIPVLRRILP